MGKYTEDAKKLLELVGGKDNISAVSHCATRMRFVLKDDKLAKVKEIEKLPSVKGSFTQGGQFQTIIGNDVSTFYNEFSSVSGLEGVSKDNAKSAAKTNMTPLQRFMTNIAEIFAPLIPALVVGGLVLGFRNILENPMYDGAIPIVKQSVFWNGVNSFLWLIAEAIFHFLPVGITWSVTKKMGTTQILGIILGLTLVSPQLLNAYGYADALAAGKVAVWDFGFFQIPKIGYQAQVIPALLAGFVLVYLERFIRKHVPDYLSMLLVPFFALIPTVILAHTVLGPAGWWLGTKISNFVLAGLTGSLKSIFSLLFGFLYAPLVITGLHHMTNAIDLQLVASNGSTQLWPMIAISNIAQGAAVLAIFLKNRRDEREKQVSVPAFISAFLGVTEPAMFGINLKYMYPFLAAMIGSGIASMVAVSLGVSAYSIGVGGLPGFLVIKDSKPIFFLAMAIAIVVPIVLTFALAKLPRFRKVEVVENTNLDAI